MELDPNVISLGLNIVSNLVVLIGQHHTSKRENSLFARLCKKQGLVPRNFHDQLGEVLKRTVERLFEQHPEYEERLALETFFKDAEVAAHITSYILDGTRIDENSLHDLLERRLREDPVGWLSVHTSGLDPRLIISEFTACYRQALRRQTDDPTLLVLLVIVEARDSLLDEVVETRDSILEKLDENEQQIREMKARLEEVGQSLLSERLATGSRERHLQDLLAGADFGREYDEIAGSATRDFTAREWVLGAVADWLAGDERDVLLLIGKPGAGKTALAAQLWNYSQGQVEPPPGAGLPPGRFVDAVHFCSVDRAGMLDPGLIARSLVKQLDEPGSSYHEALLAAAADPTSQERGEAVWTHLLVQPLKALGERKVVILIDGLDEALKHSGYANLVEHLRKTSIPGVRWLLTSRDEEPVMQRFPRERLRLVDLREPRSASDVARYVARQLGGLEPELDPERARLFVEVVTRAAGGNFLYARYVLRDADLRRKLLGELIEKGSAARIDMPADLDEIYEAFVRRLEEGGPEQETQFNARYLPILKALATAQGDGPDRDTLARLAGLERAMASFERGLEEMSTYLEIKSENVQLYHQSFAEFLVREKPARWASAYESHLQTAALLQEQWSKRRWTRARQQPYALRYTPAHWIAAVELGAARGDQEAAEGLGKALTDVAYLAERLQLDEGESGALEREYERAIRALAPADDPYLHEVFEPVRTLLEAYLKALRQESGRLKDRPADAYTQLYNRLHQSADRRVRESLEGVSPPPGRAYLLARHPLPGDGAMQRELFDDRQAMTALAIGEDARTAVSGAKDGRVRLWDLESGGRARLLQGQHTDMVRAIALTPDGRRAISGADDGSVYAWNLGGVGGEPLRLDGPRAALKALAISASGEEGVGFDAGLELWRWALCQGGESSKQELQAGIAGLLGSGDESKLEVEAAVLSPDARWLLAALVAKPERSRRSARRQRTKRALFRWDLRSGALRGPLAGYNKPLHGLAISADGRLAVSGGDDKLVRLWDIEGGAQVHCMAGHDEVVWTVAMTPDGKQALSGSGDRLARVWDLQSGQAVRTLAAHRRDILAVKLTATGRRAVTTGQDGTLCMWSLEGPAAARNGGSVFTVSVPAAGNAAVTGGEDPPLSLWDLRTGQASNWPQEHSGRVEAVAVAPLGDWAVSGDVDGALRVWNLTDGRQEREAMAGGRVTALAIAAGTRQVVAGDANGLLRRWERDGQEAPEVLLAYRGAITAVAVSPDGRYVVWGGRQDSAWMLDSESGGIQPLGVYEARRPEVALALALAPDGSVAISGGEDGMLRTWHLPAGTEGIAWEAHAGEPIWALAITPKGDKAISAGDDRTLKVWDLTRPAGDRLIACYTWDVTFRCLAVGGSPPVLVAGDERRRLLFFDVP